MFMVEENFFQMHPPSVFFSSIVGETLFGEIYPGKIIRDFACHDYDWKHLLSLSLF